ncbi:MAG: tetratricopeptide repeat protein [Bacteroides sp.]|nr:tetratricopeptide repeat protein [Bacteroides sp.]
MKPSLFLILCVAALLPVTSLQAQTASPEWQAEVDALQPLLTTAPDEADKQADALLKGKNKKNLPLLLALTQCYLDAGRYQSAEQFLTMAKKVDAKSAAVSVAEGDLALARRQVGLACQLYEQAIYFDPTYKEAYLKYAGAYRTASPAQAIQKLMQLKQQFPDCTEADRRLAEVYYGTNRFDKAIEAYSHFIDTPLATQTDLLKYAFALFLSHRFEQSLQAARRGAERNPRHAAFNRLIMYNTIDLQRLPEAEQAAYNFFHASDSADFSALDYRYQAALLASLGRPEQAIDSYRKALSADPKRIELWREIADVYESQNEFDEAILAYRNYFDALSPDRQTPDLLFFLGRLYYGDATTADTSPEEAATEGGEEVLVTAEQRASLLCADSIFALVAWQAPDSHLGNLWRARTNSALDPETTAGLAKPYYEQVAQLLLAKADGNNRPALLECYRYLGYYYLLKSDYPLSKEYWEKILQLDPENEVALKALEGMR